MTQIKNKWRMISVGYLVLSYLIIVVALKKPLSVFLIGAAIYVVLLVLVFLGTFIGLMGIIFQVFLKKESMAFPLYDKAYRFKTENPTILASYGLMLLRRNDPATALDCFERAFTYSKHYMTTKTVMSNIAICHWKNNNLNKAIKQYYAIMKRFGDDDQTFLESPEYTEEGMDTMIRQNSIMYPQDYNTLGYLYILQGDYEKAEFFTKAALASKEDYASAYDNLGQIAYYKGNFPESKELYLKALELNPNLPDSLYFIALIYKEEGDHDNALASLNKAKACSLDGLNTITVDMIDEQISLL